MQYVTWIQDNWSKIVEAWGLLVLFASAIVKLIPELPKDHWALPMVKFIAKVIALNTNAPVKRPK